MEKEKEKYVKTCYVSRSFSASSFVLVFVRAFRIGGPFAAGFANVCQELVEAERIFFLLKLNGSSAGSRGARSIRTTKIFVGNKPLKYEEKITLDKIDWPSSKE